MVPNNTMILLALSLAIGERLCLNARRIRDSIRTEKKTTMNIQIPQHQQQGMGTIAGHADQGKARALAMTASD